MPGTGPGATKGIAENDSLRIITVVGARPQFVKAAIVSRHLRDRPDVEERILHTGQHYDRTLSEIFYRELEIPPPAFELGVGSAPHGAQTGRMLETIEEVLLAERPDWVLVYGDTNSTLAGALAAAKLGIRLAHVEAGLRSHNRAMPEEINRVVADHCADLLFVPTELARANLEREGIPDERILRVGDVMYDAAVHFGARSERMSRVLETHGLAAGGFVLATVHRAENTDDPARLEAIFGALAEVAADRKVVLPLHPRTRGALEKHPSAAASLAALLAIEPVGYLDMLRLERAAAVVVTDSGGVQKEACFQGTPCVTVRDETEWRELVDIGWNRLAPPTSAAAVRDAVAAALETPPPQLADGDVARLYGDGRATERIADALLG